MIIWWDFSNIIICAAHLVFLLYLAVRDFVTILLVVLTDCISEEGNVIASVCLSVHLFALCLLFD